MKFTLAAFAMAIIGATAQVSTVSAPCGTACPTTISDRMITRSTAYPTTTAPCPSLIVSSIAGAKNGSNPMATGMPTASPSAFTGGAVHVAGSVGAAVAAVAAVLAL